MDPQFGLVYIPQQVDQEKSGICSHEESVISRREAIREIEKQPHDIKEEI